MVSFRDTKNGREADPAWGRVAARPDGHTAAVERMWMSLYVDSGDAEKASVWFDLGSEIIPAAVCHLPMGLTHRGLPSQPDPQTPTQKELEAPLLLGLCPHPPEGPPDLTQLPSILVPSHPLSSSC